MQRKQKDTMWERDQQEKGVGKRGGKNIRGDYRSNSNQNMRNTYKKLSRNKFY